jgi:hypothetical protein
MNYMDTLRGVKGDPRWYWHAECARSLSYYMVTLRRLGAAAED